jgi:ribonuclease R
MRSNKVLQGYIKRHPDGFGFFIPDAEAEHADVYIPAHSMKSAMTNDRVSVTVEKERDGRFRGEIVRITERSQKKIAGKFQPLNSQFGVIRDEGKGWGADLKIPLEKSLGARPGELVAAQITSYPDNGSFLGAIYEVLGDAAAALNDVKRVIVNQNIPDEFSSATLKEAQKFQGNPTEADFKNRRDLRKLPIITIDGATAKDFDDAVYVEFKKTGFKLIVAIADVSHYVKVGSSMDKEAYEKGTSVYFPNFVVPMLPETLSNGLCSLNPNVPRLALVAEMHFDFEGAMQTSSFYEAVIESQARCTYGEAQEIVDGVDIEKHTSVPGVKDNILRCADLAKVLMARRFKEGSLDLEVPETELVIDGTGEPVDVIKSERLFAHRLIEELMLAANVAVAKFLSAKEIPSIYRTHEPPDPLKIQLLQKFIASFGSKADLSGTRLQKKLTRALQEMTHDAHSHVVHILTLRSMSQAKYTLENIGHFGLGFDHYTHFTSPIRRYPDLIVHRLLKNQIGLSNYRLMSDEDLQTAGTWLSACEQRAAKSERQIHAIKKARFMKKFIGQEFDGIVSSVTKFGLFVLLRTYNIDGLVRIEDLSNVHPGTWEFDEESLKLVSKRSGFSYAIGDPIKIIVSAVDIEQGQINFTLAQKGAKNNYEVKPRYRSLSDYLDQKKTASGNHGKKNTSQSNKKPTARSAKDRKNTQERSTPTNDSNGVRKARPSKSRRKSKSR